MSATWGKNIKLTIFGESHGEAIGVTVDGLPSGIKIDMDKISKEMQRRSSRGDYLSTPRIEEDIPEIISGFFNGFTTGAPLTALIKNKNTNSKDYDDIKDVARPGHADYVANIKYLGYNDYRGGGHFSGRLTAPLVFVGAIVKQILDEKKIYIGSHINSIGSFEDLSFSDESLNVEYFDKLSEERLPFINTEIKDDVIAEIKKVKLLGDSIGGVVECAAIGVPVGLGEPFFESVESVISSMIFSIPSVKGIEFGRGFEISKMLGSNANDEFYYDENGNVKTHSNNNGGINGGITNGMPVVFRVAIKPTPSISKKQNTINLKNMSNKELEIVGRHDPVIVPRVVPVIEAVTAIAILDMYLEQNKYRA